MEYDEIFKKYCISVSATVLILRKTIYLPKIDKIWENSKICSKAVAEYLT